MRGALTNYRDSNDIIKTYMEQFKEEAVVLVADVRTNSNKRDQSRLNFEKSKTRIIVKAWSDVLTTSPG